MDLIDVLKLLTLKEECVICSVVSDSLWPHESQHARPPCPSPTSGVHSDSRPSSERCHLAISSSVVPFSSCPQSFPASESFPMSQLFAWGGQSTGVSALASVLPKKSQGWSQHSLKNKWDVLKVILRVKFIVIQAFLKKREKYLIKLTYHLKQLGKTE